MSGIGEQSFWRLPDNIAENLKDKELADVFRFVSFGPFEMFGPHLHRRIEINYVRKGSCIIRLDGHESISFKENEMMIISSEAEHLFEAGPKGCTLMQLEFLPEMFSKFDLRNGEAVTAVVPTVFSDGNRLIKIVNNIRLVRAVQRIVNELNDRKKYYRYLVLMYYAELLILINRHMEEVYLPGCSNGFMQKAIGYIRTNYQSDINITDVAEYSGVGERYLRKLFARYLNISPLDYLNQLRVNKSIELLRNTEMSVKEICFTCGFNSPQYFSKIFKQYAGVSPREITR